MIFNIEELDANGRPVKMCEEDIAVNKCEGNCVSKVQPSVNTPSGFLKVRLSSDLLAEWVKRRHCTQGCRQYHYDSAYSASWVLTPLKTIKLSVSLASLTFGEIV